jgi:hypothetical protein
MADWERMLTAMQPIPTTRALPTTLEGGVAYYTQKIQAAGNDIAVGVYFFRKFIRSVRKDYIDLVTKLKEIQNLRSMDVYSDLMDTEVKDFPRLQKYMNIVIRELMRVVPDYSVLMGKQEYEQYFLGKLHALADANRMYFGSGKKKTRKVRKQNRRKTRGKRLRK